MNVCLDVRYTTRSGASTVIEAFLEHLPSSVRGYNIDLVTHADHERDRSKLRVPFRNRLLEFQWSQTVLAQQLKRRRYDIYHSLKHVGPIRCPVRSIYRVPAVGQFIGQYPQKVMDQIYWGHAARHVYRQADVLIAVSEYVKRGLVEYLKVPSERVRIIHNGVDPRFQPIAKTEEQSKCLRQLGINRSFLLCVANVVPVKNLSTAVEALARLAGDDLQLVIAGNARTSEALRLKQLAAEIGVSDQIVFLGRVGAEELLVLYNHAELLLHPSFHEGLSSTLLEAMSCGLPIVASNATSIPETLGDAACYHKPANVDQLAAQIEQLLGDNRLQTTMSERGRQRATEFSWQRCVGETLALYAELN